MPIYACRSHAMSHQGECTSLIFPGTSLRIHSAYLGISLTTWQDSIFLLPFSQPYFFSGIKCLQGKSNPHILKDKCCCDTHKAMCMYVLLDLCTILLSRLPRDLSLYRILCHLKMGMFALDQRSSKDAPRNRTKIGSELLKQNLIQQ